MLWRFQGFSPQDMHTNFEQLASKPGRRIQMAVIGVYCVLAILWAAARILLHSHICQLQLFLALQGISTVISLVVESSSGRSLPKPLTFILGIIRKVGDHGHSHSHGSCDCSHENDDAIVDPAALHVAGLPNVPSTDRIHILLRMAGYIFAVFGGLTTVAESVEHSLFHGPSHKHHAMILVYLGEGLFLLLLLAQTLTNLFVTLVLRTHSKAQPLGMGEWAGPIGVKPMKNPTIARTLWISIEPLVPVEHHLKIQRFLAVYAASLLCDVVVPVAVLAWYCISSSVEPDRGVRASIILSLFWIWFGIGQLVVDGAVLSDASPEADSLRGLLVHGHVVDQVIDHAEEEGIQGRCLTKPTSVLCASAFGHDLGEGIELVEGLLWVHSIGELCGVFRIRRTGGGVGEGEEDWRHRALAQLGNTWGTICSSMVVHVVQ